MDNLDEKTPPSTETHQDDQASIDKGTGSASSFAGEALVWDKAAERRAVHKLDLTLVPLTTMIYLLSFLDRTNIGSAKVAGMQKDLKLTANQFSVALTVTYVLFILSEIPSNLLMKKFGANNLIPGLTILWGMVCACQGAVKSYSGLLGVRFMLGLVEGGLLPGLVLYMSWFYKRHDLSLRLAFVLSMTALAGAFSGLLASAISHLEGKRGLAGWSWIFIIEGVFTIAFGIFCWLVLPRRPRDAPFLTNEEATAYEKALEQDWQKEKEHEPFSWSEALSAFKSPHLLIFSPALFFNGVTLFGLAFFAPTIVGALGNSPNRTQLLVVPPYACAFVVAVTASLVSDHIKQRGIFMISIATIAIAGYALFLGSASKHVDYGALFLQVTGAYATAPFVASWQANNFLPYYKRATAVGWGFVMTNSGGILSTWIFNDPPRFRLATRLNLAFSVGIVVMSATNMGYLIWANAQKKKVGVEERKALDNEEARQRLGDRHPDFMYTP
ncbi:MFS general substrate transporter [Sistotremastrum suecicum HHB10207 ss-3]|uniref:MFS general substrate transporter n=1 Tax=Sistotremastrum suecicum HHB10207 ss-3 TaxID=1314776 RepID=A0A166H6B5_9AGAM|nr:MFS general substrate transporter [Sistotremastrum suecicum HHB10207 ss-3]